MQAQSDAGMPARATDGSQPARDVKGAGVVLWTEEGQMMVGWDRRKRKWSEPGGRRQHNETAEACAARAVEEETGLRADELGIDWSQPAYVEQCKYAVFQGRLGRNAPRPTDKVTEFKSVSVRDPPQDYNFRLKRVVAWLLSSNARRARAPGLLDCWPDAGPTPAATARPAAVTWAAIWRLISGAGHERGQILRLRSIL